MAALGADVEQLDTLARQLRTAAAGLSRIEVDVTNNVRTTWWIGPDADTFRSRWTSTMAPRVRSAAELLTARAGTLDEQARQQREASDLLPPGSRPPDRPVPLPLPANRVERTEILRLHGEAGALWFQKGSELTLKVEYLADGTARVTVLGGKSRGVGEDEGARIELDAGRHELRGGGVAGGGGDGRVQVGARWVVPADEVDEVAASLGLDAADPTRQLRRVGGLLPGDAGEVARRYSDYRRPPPVRVGVDVGASAGLFGMLGLNGVSVDGERSAGIQIGGFREADGDVGVRVERTSAGSAGLDVPALSIPGLLEPPAASTTQQQAVEVVLGPDGQPKQLVVEQLTTGDNRSQLSTTTVDIVTPEQREDVTRILDVFRRPMSTTPIDAEIDPADWTPYTNTVTANLEVSGEDYGAGAGIGLPKVPVDGSVDVGLERQTTHHHYVDQRL